MIAIFFHQYVTQFDDFRPATVRGGKKINIGIKLEDVFNIVSKQIRKIL